MAVSVLEPFRAVVDERNLGVVGVHIHRRGRQPVVHRSKVDDRDNVHSISKTVTALAIGIARDEGRLDLDDAALSHLPELAGTAAPGAEAITLRHLLTMTSGIDYRWPDPDFAHEGDPAAAFLSSPVRETPGQVFRYRGTSTYLLGRIIHRLYGQDLRDFLVPRLFTPLGIVNPQWHRCPLGHPLAADGLHLRTSEIARLGETVLERGVFRGRRIVSADFVAQLTETRVDSTGLNDHPESCQGYGLAVWHCTRAGTVRMEGLYGQLCVIAPDLGTCIALTGHYEGNIGDIVQAVWSHLLPALQTK
ncbi:serine hydrolase [Actinocatenispora sera]|uniref:serine hydrolase domain-containing protein n=1 Tax=Actinocatenispora sera TaxID=390989 RepID=UPI0033F28D91